jgi:arylsulfatase
MINDPSQTTNVSEDFPEVVKSMRKAYEEFWEETRPLMVNEDVPMSTTRPYHILYSKQLSERGIPDWIEPKL